MQDSREEATVYLGGKRQGTIMQPQGMQCLETTCGGYSCLCEIDPLISISKIVQLDHLTWYPMHSLPEYSIEFILTAKYGLRLQIHHTLYKL